MGDVIRAVPVDRPEVPPRPISARLRTQLVYFASVPEAGASAEADPSQFRFTDAEVERALDEGVIYLVSPLDTANFTEVEISEEQEDFLTWLRDQRVRHIRIDD